MRLADATSSAKRRRSALSDLLEVEFKSGLSGGNGRHLILIGASKMLGELEECRFSMLCSMVLPERARPWWPSVSRNIQVERARHL